MTKDDQIFDHIRELMTRDDFRNAQAEFFKANHGKFQTQENEGEAQFRLEHKTIHEDYLGLVERFIEMKLQMEFGHSDEDMDHFYLTFKDKFKAYETKDPESVDILYGFLDLEKFFNQMIETGKALKAAGLSNDESARIQQEQILQDKVREKAESKEYLDLLYQNSDDPAFGWTKKVEQKEYEHGSRCKVYQKKQEGGIDIAKVECEFENLEFQDLTDYFLNPPMENTPMMKVNEVIERKMGAKPYEYDKKKYWRIQIPMMSDRDNVLKTSFKQQEDGRLFGMVTSIEHPDYPPQPNCVRMHNFMLFSLEKCADGRLLMKEISYTSMKGYVPNSLLNMMMTNEMFKEHKTMAKTIFDKKNKA